MSLEAPPALPYLCVSATGFDWSCCPEKHSDVALVLLQALSTSKFYIIMKHCRPWVKELLLGAISLAALSTSTGALPGGPIAQCLPLRHLELFLSHVTEDSEEQILADVSCCLTLESLRISSSGLGLMVDSEGLAGMHFHSMPCLKHVRLDGCYPYKALQLPADCSLFLDLSCMGNFKFHEHDEKFRDHAIVLRLNTADDTDWPSGLLKLSKLQFLELDSVGGFSDQDLADLQHIPEVKISLDSEDQLLLTGGSWDSFEIFQFGQLDLTISDVDSFVRGTKSFTLMSESSQGASKDLFRELKAACRRQGKKCHIGKHMGLVKGEMMKYATLSTSKEIAKGCPTFYDEFNKDHHPIDLGRDKTLFDWDAFWQCDPFASVRKPEPEPELW